MCVLKDMHGHVPEADRPAGQTGSSPERGAGGRSAAPPHVPCASPPAAASRWPPPAPELPPSPGSAAEQTEVKQSLMENIPVRARDYGKCASGTHGKLPCDDCLVKVLLRTQTDLDHGFFVIVR